VNVLPVGDFDALVLFPSFGIDISSPIAVEKLKNGIPACAGMTD
jgi:hypothetical protein